MGLQPVDERKRVESKGVAGESKIGMAGQVETAKSREPNRRKTKDVPKFE